MLRLGSILQLVRGTGPDGSIRADDVLNFTPSAGAPPAVGAPTAPGAFVDIPVTGMRKVSMIDSITGRGGDSLV